MKSCFLYLIKFYQWLISPALTVLLGYGAGCRYNPSCSQYTYQAIETYGLLKGIYFGVKRVFRCHPFTKGGHDPLPKAKGTQLN